MSPLINRTKPVTSVWSLHAAEVGGMWTAGMSPNKIASKMNLSLAYVALLVDLYRGMKEFPKIVKYTSFQQARQALQEFRHKKLLEELGEKP